MVSGADGLMVHHPIHPYTSEPGLVRYYEALAEALPGVPPILYVRGPQLSADGVRRLARDRVDRRHQDGPGRPGALRRIPSPPHPTSPGSAASPRPGPCRSGRPARSASRPGIANVAPERSLDVLAALKAGDVARAEGLRRAPAPDRGAARSSRRRQQRRGDQGGDGHGRPCRRPSAPAARPSNPTSAPSSSTSSCHGAAVMTAEGPESVACSTSACRSPGDPGSLEAARRFYGEILGLAERSRPPRSRASGSGTRPGRTTWSCTCSASRPAWLRTANRGAIRASRSTTSAGFRAHLVAAGVTTRDDDGEIPGRPRFFGGRPVRQHPGVRPVRRRPLVGRR